MTAAAHAASAKRCNSPSQRPPKEMKYPVTRFKDLKTALKELEPFVPAAVYGASSLHRKRCHP
jgi:hypothetical protein